MEFNKSQTLKREAFELVYIIKFKRERVWASLYNKI